MYRETSFKNKHLYDDVCVTKGGWKNLITSGNVWLMSLSFSCMLQQDVYLYQLTLHITGYCVKAACEMLMLKFISYFSNSIIIDLVLPCTITAITAHTTNINHY